MAVGGFASGRDAGMVGTQHGHPSSPSSRPVRWGGLSRAQQQQCTTAGTAQAAAHAGGRSGAPSSGVGLRRRSSSVCHSAVISLQPGRRAAHGAGVGEVSTLIRRAVHGHEHANPGQHGTRGCLLHAARMQQHGTSAAGRRAVGLAGKAHRISSSMVASRSSCVMSCRSFCASSVAMRVCLCCSVRRFTCVGCAVSTISTCWVVTARGAGARGGGGEQVSTQFTTRRVMPVSSTWRLVFGAPPQGGM